MTELGRRFYTAYTASDRTSDTTPMYAAADNLIIWETIEPLVEGEDNKNRVFFPKKLDGRFVTFHRRPPSVWLAFSSDMRRWTDHLELLSPRPGLWGGKRVGASRPLTSTDAGWLICRGYDDAHVYRMVAALLYERDPTRVLKRPEGFVLEPQTAWELRGDAPNVVSITADPVVDGAVSLYYGSADRVVYLARADLEELLTLTLENG